MKNKKFVLGMLVLTLIFGLMVIGCPEPSDPLNGTWVNEDGSTIMFNNGNLESYVGGVLYSKGTYTTNNGILYMEATHVYGSTFGLEPRLYTKNELKSALVPSIMTEEYFNSSISIQLSSIYNYTISGNTLTLVITFPGGTVVTQTLTKQ